MKQAFVIQERTVSMSDSDHGDDEVIGLYVRCFGAMFSVDYLRKNLSLSPCLLAEFEKSLAIVRGDDDRASEMEFCRLKKAFEELMIELAPNPIPSIEYLSDYLYQPVLVLEAIAVTQDSTVIEPYFKGQYPGPANPGDCLLAHDDELLKPLQYSTSSQIRLVSTSPNPEHHPCIVGPTKVVAKDGAVCHFKQRSSWQSLRKGKTWIHMEIAAAIEAKKLRCDIRICRLHSVIMDDSRNFLQHCVWATKKEMLEKWGVEDGSEGEEYADPNYKMERLVGILLHYIENKGTLEHIVRWSKCSDEHRRRWATELENLVGELHAAGLIWGDAKPSNVLVDRDDQLWVIDLEGSYTPGWVDEANKDSREGDLQGVKRIKEWLAKCGEKPVDRVVLRNN